MNGPRQHPGTDRSRTDDPATVTRPHESTEWHSVLNSEYAQLGADADAYASRAVAVLGGLIGLSSAAAWYLTSTSGTFGPIYLGASFLMLGVTIYFLFCYLVYRTVKGAKSIQAARINKVFKKDNQPLLWELRVWKPIWGGGPLPHSPLAWTLLAVIASTFIIPEIYCVYNAYCFLVANVDKAALPISAIYLIFMCICWAALSIIFAHVIRKISRVLSEVSAEYAVD